MIRLKVIFAAVVATLFIAACGGGGSGGGDATATPTGVSITPDNAEAAATEVVSSVDLVEGASGGSTFLTGAVVSDGDGGFNYPDFVLAQFDHFSVVSEAVLSSGLVGVTVSETVECDPGKGDITVSGDVQVPGSVTSGDTLSLAFNDCTLGGVFLSGRFDMTIVTITPGFDGTPPFELTVNTALRGFVAAADGETFSSSGDMTLGLTDDGAGNITATLSGSRLTASVAGETKTLSDYRYVLAGNDNTGDYTIEAQGTIDSTILGGSVSFTSITPFSGNDFGITDNPTSGTLLMTSDLDDSRARIVAQPDGENIEILVDADGDGTFEESIMTTWAVLEL